MGCALLAGVVLAATLKPLQLDKSALLERTVLKAHLCQRRATLGRSAVKIWWIRLRGCVMLGIIALHLLWFQTRMVMMAPVDHVQLVIIARQAQRHPLHVQPVVLWNILEQIL
jgi:hypothetical protein